MDDQQIADHSSVSPVVEEDMAGSSATRSPVASVSEGNVPETVHSFQTLPERFPGEDSGRSLAEMAHRDLDAALQLLAERAQYITDASGAAIALRRGEHNDMICRASAGANAPELGALLSMEYGLSGESVRTRQLLRCDEAESDPRVNREVCRQLGIASVAVMPIVSEQQVFGVFELLSGKPRAFDERDLSALQRLSGMVETAVKHAVAAQTVVVPEPTSVELQPPATAEAVEVQEAAKVETIIADGPIKVAAADTVASPVVEPVPAAQSAPSESAPPADAPAQQLTNTGLENAKTEAAAKKPVFWSAAVRTSVSADQPDPAAESLKVPAVLRTLQKCQACGFPVSHGRTFCVECEEKQWRGQRIPQPASGPAQKAGSRGELQVARPTETGSAVSVAQEFCFGRDLGQESGTSC